jgi:cobyrinic acid a,c-diamide synthase
MPMTMQSQNATTVPRLLIAGVTSGVGKTLVSTSIMYYFESKGFQVQPFKVGPDFIDPTYHAAICKRNSYNLDVWMMGKGGVLNKFNRTSMHADIAIIEGVMGVFDGVFGKSGYGSTAHVARILNSPIILVVDASRAGESIAALVYGFLNFDNRVDVLGLVLNNVASLKHLRTIKEGMRKKINVPIVGVIFKNKVFELNERHLGLIPVLKAGGSNVNRIVTMSRLISKNLCLNRLPNFHVIKRDTIPISTLERGEPVVKIAIAKDESFNFYYPDTIESLKLNNAEIISFSPVNDKRLPDGISGLILGGGFPEILAEHLAKNYRIKKSILREAENGMPIYAECGGLMYLTKAITQFQKGKKTTSKMIGLVDADTVMTDRPVLNYTEAVNRGSFFRDIRKVRGHEFHYSIMHNIGKDLRFAYALRRGNGISNNKDGVIVYNCLASYMHLHFGGDQRLARRFVDLCRNYSRK